MQFRSFRSKTLFTMIPLVMVILMAMTGISYFFAKAVIVEKTNDAMSGQLNQINNEIRKRIAAHTKLPEVLAGMTGSLAAQLSPEQFDAMLRDGLKSNAETFGMGIFFEPYAFRSKTQFFSTYAFDDGKSTAITHEYSDESYNYPEQPWYKIVKEAKTTVYTEPYYDEMTKVTMLTAGAPVWDAKKTFIGVATGDINLNTLQKMVAETKAGETGWAFLLDKTGMYMAGKDEDKVMKVNLKDDPDRGWAEVGGAMLANKTGSMTYSGGAGKLEVYYKDIAETGWTLALVIPHEELYGKLDALLRQLLVMAAVSMVLLVLAITLYSRSITGQIRLVNRFSEALAAGDFTFSQPVRGRDEFARMTGNFNRTTETLRIMVSTVTDHTLHVASTSEELMAGAEQTGKASETITEAIEKLALGAEEQRRSTEESSRAMEEMAQGISRIAETSAVAAEISQTASESALKGNGMISQAVAGMEELSLKVERAVVTMDQLAEMSGRIGGIVEMISGISSQTHMLALNAAIEAARAGEAGRGFAVVATEVRKLADQTKHFTDEIAVLVTDIQGQTAAASDAMHKGNAEVKQGAALVRDTGEIFGTINKHIEVIVEQIQEVSAASEELSAGAQEISASVDDLAGISRAAAEGSRTVAASSEEQLASMEEINSSALSLAKMVSDLQELLGKFKV